MHPRLHNNRIIKLKLGSLCKLSHHHHHQHRHHHSYENLQYTNLFSLLKSPPHLFEARRLHALLLLAGFFHPACADRVLGSQLVSIYVTFGSLTHALLVFHKLPLKNNIAWNAILRGLVELGRFSEAIHLYHSMLGNAQIPDNYTYPLVLKACAGLPSLEEGRRVFQRIRNNNHHHHNIHVQRSLIDMFAKCGSLDEARNVFEKMPIKDLASWSSMICGSVHNGQWIEALQLLRELRLEGLRPDSVIVASALPACSRLELKHVGMALQGCSLKFGFASDLYITNALMDMYCKCGDTEDAYSVFRTLGFRDVVSWSTMIAGFAHNGQYHRSLHHFKEMKDSNIICNAVIVASVLPVLGKLKLLKQGKEMHNYVLKQGFEWDAVVGSALIDMYASCGSKREAGHVFRSMSHRDITVWNSMMAGLASCGTPDEAFTVFRKIWGAKLRPNSISLVSILPLCTGLGRAMQGKEIHGYATRSGMMTVLSIANCLIDMYCKCGYLEHGMRMFDQVIQKNVVTYNTMLSALGIHGRAEQAFTVFDHMTQDANIKPNKVTYVSLLSTCSHAGLVDRGWCFYNSMREDYGILPDMEHYACMADLLGRAGSLVDAFKFIQKIPMDPNFDVWRTLLGSCRVHNKVELAEFVGERIMMQKEEAPSDSGYYVLLSNVYACGKRWEDAQMVRRMIKEKGLEKKPGCSWIQVGNALHEFHTAGRVHPEMNKIHETLKCLLFEMKYKGCIALL